MTMETVSILMLVGAGVIGGIISSLAGGSSVITFPAMLAAGVPPIIANASHSIATMPGNPVAALLDWPKRPKFGTSFFGLVIASAVCGAVGASLLLLTPERLFKEMVPLLIGLATLLFAYSRHISRQLRSWLSTHTGTRIDAPGVRLALLIPVSIYGGYFGAGLGILLLGVLSVGTTDEQRSVNVAKNLFGFVINLAGAAVFVYQDSVAWQQTLAMMGGILIGAFVGMTLIKKVPDKYLRTCVISFGALVTLVYAWRYWF